MEVFDLIKPIYVPFYSYLILFPYILEPDVNLKFIGNTYHIALIKNDH